MPACDSMASEPAPSALASRPEYPLAGRHLAAYRWLPPRIDNLLDAGCAWGYATRCFATRAAHAAGIDPDVTAIAVARHRYPEIDFVQATLEDLPFDDESFDVVTCCDTLEHVADERGSLEEIWRVLRPGGVLILSTPHRGLFAWLDHANYVPALRAAFARRLPRTFAMVQRTRRKPCRPVAEYEWQRHRHYSLGDFRRLFETTSMSGHYRIERIRRSGLVVFPLALSLTFFASPVPAPLRRRLLAPVQWLAEREYWMPCGSLAYNIAVRIVKQPGA